MNCVVKTDDGEGYTDTVTVEIVLISLVKLSFLKKGLC